MLKPPTRKLVPAMSSRIFSLWFQPGGLSWIVILEMEMLNNHQDGNRFEQIMFYLLQDDSLSLYIYICYIYIIIVIHVIVSLNEPAVARLNAQVLPQGTCCFFCVWAPCAPRTNQRLRCWVNGGHHYCEVGKLKRK
jgi:hypothetical protein